MPKSSVANRQAQLDEFRQFCVWLAWCSVGLAIVGFIGSAITGTLARTNTVIVLVALVVLAVIGFVGRRALGEKVAALQLLADEQAAADDEDDDAF